jgi:hypothetical protein
MNIYLITIPCKLHKGGNKNNILIFASSSKKNIIFNVL